MVRTIENFFQSLYNRMVGLIYIIGLLLASPICLLGVMVAWLNQKQNVSQEKTTGEKKKVLITGIASTKTLHVIRIMGKAGFDVILADWVGFSCLLHYSKYVSKVVRVPPRNGRDFSKYIDAVVQVGLENNVEYYLPVSKMEYSVADAMIGEKLLSLKPDIRCLSSDSKLIEELDDKRTFMNKCRSYGLSVPDFIYFQEEEKDIFQLAAEGRFAKEHLFLKAFDSIACPSFRSNFNRIPSEQNELREYLKDYDLSNFFANQYISGRELVANLMSVNGKVIQLNICSSSPIQMDYDVLDHPKITEWVKSFCRQSNFTGAICFDFLEDAQGEIYCIECNPRIHSAITAYLYDNALARCFQQTMEGDDTATAPMLEPSRGTYVYWLYQEVLRLLSSQRSLKEFLNILESGDEAVWDTSDPLPFFILHHVQMPLSVLQKVVAGDAIETINFCIGYAYTHHEYSKESKLQNFIDYYRNYYKVR